MDLSKLSETKLALLRSCYEALLNADDDKITAVQEKYFSSDDWCEEECTPVYPVIEVYSSGVCTILYLDNTNCLSDDIEF